jgi:3-keto-5-aminohexanoate cleavage enzyme
MLGTGEVFNNQTGRQKHMSSQLKEKLIVLVAPTGETPSRDGGPNVPCTPEEIAEEVYRCYQAGASVVHVHARDKKTRLHTSDLSVFKEILTRIKEKCDILIQLTGAMGALQDPVTKEWMPPKDEARMALLDLEPKPDMTCAPTGSSNYYGPAGNYATLINTPDFLKKLFKRAKEKKLRNEWEIWDVSYLHNALRLADEGVFDKNGFVWLNICMGGGDGYQPTTVRQLIQVSEEAKRLFPQAVWELTARQKFVFPLHAIAMSLGCNISRVGLEDYIYLPNGEIAKNNIQIVESTVNIAKAVGREIATVAEAKEIMGLPIR